MYPFCLTRTVRVLFARSIRILSVRIIRGDKHPKSASSL
jgi:hypothetical protein